MFYIILFSNCVMVSLMIISYITNYICIYTHNFFFSSESVVRYFPSQYCLRGIYIKRGVTVRVAHVKGQRHSPEPREGVVYQGWRNVQGPHPGCPGRLHGECSTLKNDRTENDWRVARFILLHEQKAGIRMP